jgi:hypothetical protein|tara:strand:+ start:2979 stop:3350 length:372 start_codon:yes stop_codon:yes gene_type:complete
MLLDGDQNDRAKAIEWVRKVKRANLRNRINFKVENGKLYSGYTEDVDRNLKMCETRRHINNEQKQGEIQALAAFSPVAIRNYARRIGVPVAEMYRNPEFMKKMIKDRDYAKFRVNERAAHILS